MVSEDVRKFQGLFFWQQFVVQLEDVAVGLEQVWQLDSSLGTVEGKLVLAFPVRWSDHYATLALSLGLD